MAKSLIFVTEHIRNVHSYLCSDADNTIYDELAFTKEAFSLSILLISTAAFDIFSNVGHTTVFLAIHSALIGSMSDLFHLWDFI